MIVTDQLSIRWVRVMNPPLQFARMYPKWIDAPDDENSGFTIAPLPPNVVDASSTSTKSDAVRPVSVFVI